MGVSTTTDQVLGPRVLLTPLTGRERDIARVLSLLRSSDVRLVTVSGPGGVGKTRLALQIASELSDEFADGVAFVALDPIRDPALVTPTVAQAFGLRETADQSWFERLAEFLRRREQLLILDNFEQVVDAAPVVGELLTTCSQLKMLVTSREVLRISGERDHPLYPLDLPGVRDEVSPQAMADVGSVSLFVQRARAALPTFRLTADNAAAVAEICRRLDGLPLAIELAAARIKVLSPQALLARLDQRLTLLTGGPRDQPARLQTMRDAIAWSYDLLSPAEKTLFRRLTVFAGGFTIDAAQAVGEGSGDRGQGSGAEPVSFDPRSLTPDPSVFDGLASLVDKSLLRSAMGAETGDVRFAMLETIRAFGQDQLTAAGEERKARRRHAEWARALAEEAEPQLVGPQQEAWLDGLDAERDNLRAALAWAIDQREAETGVRLAGALWRFWATRGYLTEGRDWLERILALDHTASSAHAKARHHLGNLALDLGDYDRARASYEAGRALFRDCADRRGLAMSFNGLGLLAFYQADYTEARRLHEASLALRREFDDRQGLGNSLTNLGNVANAEGDYIRARDLHEQALAVRQGMGDTGGVAYSLFNLGDVARQEGDIERARTLFDQCLGLFREVGDKLGIGYALYDLGRVAHLQGRSDTAVTSFGEALRLRQELGDKRGMVECLEGLAPVALALGDAPRAGRLFGAVEAQRDLLDVPLPPTEAAAHAREVAALQRRRGEQRMLADWSAGRTLTLDEAVAAALVLTDGISPERTVDAAPEPMTTDMRFGLSEREIDVLRLLAAGLTDRKIAETLFISPRTVNVHVANLRGKLGVSSRAAAVALAHRHQLL